MNLKWLPLPVNILYSQPRAGAIKKIVVHWTASRTLESAFNELKKSGKSYHYMVDGTTIWQLVDEKRVAYHAGNWLVNLQSLGVSHVGIYEQPIKEDSYATSAQLIAELCHRNNIVPDGATIVPHRSIKATACPGTLDLNRLITEARQFYFGLTVEVVPSIPSQYPKVMVTNAKCYRRAEADRSHAPVEQYEKGQQVRVIGETRGETVTQNGMISDLWYNTGYGYIWSKCFN